MGQLSEYKLRAANAESSLSSLATDATRVTQLEKEVRDKNALISKLRHDGAYACRIRLTAAIVTNEHLTQALRRLGKNTTDTNVDRYVLD